MRTDTPIIYSLIFDIPKDGVKVQEFVDGMRECLLALEDIHHAIIFGIDSSIEVVSFIENIEIGSLVYKLKDFVKKITKNSEATIDLASTTVSAKHGLEYGVAISLMLKQARSYIIFFE